MRVLFIGGWGHHYMRAAVEAGLAERVGTASDGFDTDTARQRGGGEPFFDDYRRAIDELKPDVVNVGAVYGHAGEVNADCLRRGAKVVSDKPVAATWRQLEAIEQACTEHSVLITEFDFRARPCFRAARRAVAEGLIGEPVLATAQKSYRWGRRPAFYKRRADYGGTLLWIASHGIDAIDYVLDRPITWVTGRHGNVAKSDYGEMEDHVMVCYELANGGGALVHADLLRPSAAPTHGDDRLRVVGSRGQIEIRDDVCTLITDDQGPRPIDELGGEADLAADLVAALNGETAHFGTAWSLRAARLLLTSRDACDRRAWLAVDPRGGGC